VRRAELRLRTLNLPGWLPLDPSPDPPHTASMTNRKLIVLSVALLCCLTGCLEFERQTMSFRHDAATDTLYIFQDYQGIFGVDDPARLTEAETNQLASVMQGERTFFFNNWIAEYNRDGLREKQRTPKGELDANDIYEATIRALVETALANVRVENVGFYLNREQRLCGAQRVTVKNVSQVLAALNRVLRFVARDEAAKEDKTPEEKQRLLAFGTRGEKALRLEGNRLEIRWPVTEEDYRSFRDRTPQGRAFQAAGGVMTCTDGVIVLTLGKPEATSVSLTLPYSDKPYVGNSLAEARKYGIKETFDAAGSATAFLSGPGSTTGKEK
jgi:hypothetical protein